MKLLYMTGIMLSPSWPLRLQNFADILREHLFIYLYFSLHNSTVSNLDCIALVIVMMNCTRCRRKRLWPNMRYYAGICQVQLRKHSGFFVSQAIFHPVTNTSYKYYPLSQLALYIVYLLLCKTIRGSYNDLKFW
jgi:hypothetical protein